MTASITQDIFLMYAQGLSIGIIFSVSILLCKQIVSILKISSK